MIENILSMYKRMFTKYPWAVVVGVLSYLIFFATFFLKISPFEWIRAPHEARELRMRVLDLEMQRRQQDLLLATLTARTPQADYLKPLKFEENWRDEHTRETIGRLVEYAEFALSKNDFEHAERFYTEASEMQPTITIPYYEGRLAYRRGDLQRAEVKWLEAIKRDPEGKYPDLRLYLGILYYQIGRASEAKQYFEYSVGHNAKP